MTEARKTTPRRRRPERLIDPYVVCPHTWTREELLAARGEPCGRKPTRRHRTVSA